MKSLYTVPYLVYRIPVTADISKWSIYSYITNSIIKILSSREEAEAYAFMLNFLE